MTKEALGACNTSNRAVLARVQETANLCQPRQVFWCNGSKAETAALTQHAVD